jgi:hypothetical protein
MKKKLTGLVLLILLAACVKNQLEVKKVIYEFTLSKHSVQADGSTRVDITVKLSPDAEPGKRGVIFKTSSGNFTGGANGTLTVQADFDHNILLAKTSITAPSSGSKIYLSVMPDIPDKEKYTLYDSITVSKSMPDAIRLNPSSFGLRANYASSDTLTGTLKNADGNNVSSGTRVVFEDVLPRHLAAGGQFRSIAAGSDAKSTVSAIYANGSQLVGTFIFLRATVLDAAGNKTTIKDSVKITITP